MAAEAGQTRGSAQAVHEWSAEGGASAAAASWSSSQPGAAAGSTAQGNHRLPPPVAPPPRVLPQASATSAKAPAHPPGAASVRPPVPDPRDLTDPRKLVEAVQEAVERKGGDYPGFRQQSAAFNRGEVDCADYYGMVTPPRTLLGALMRGGGEASALLHEQHLVDVRHSNLATMGRRRGWAGAG